VVVRDLDRRVEEVFLVLDGHLAVHRELLAPDALVLLQVVVVDQPPGDLHEVLVVPVRILVRFVHAVGLSGVCVTHCCARAAGASFSSPWHPSL